MQDKKAFFETLAQKPLGFGAMRLPVLGGENKDVDIATVSRMVDAHLDAGFRYFDTAYIYHGGNSETALREALVKRHPRDSFLLADKMPCWLVKEAADYPRLFQEQLDRCGVTHFDFYLLHNMSKEGYPDTHRLGGFDYLKQLKAEGKITYGGFSFHDDHKTLDRILTEHPDVDFVQLQINYADWTRPAIESGACYEVARRHGVPIIVMEPLKGGGLAALQGELADLLTKCNPNLSQAAWALRFATSLPGVFMVLSGMSTPEQMSENLRIMDNPAPLSDAEQATLVQVREALSKVASVPCTSCRYCVDDCPQNINIPALFGVYNAKLQFGDASIPGMHYSRATQDAGKAGDCIACGACSTHCPQHIDIVEDLKKVSAIFDK